MIREAIQYLYELGVSTRAPHREVIAGIEYTDKDLKPIMPLRAAPLGIHRLQGLTDFMLTENESIDKEHILVHVASPWKVSYLSTLDKDHRNREVYAEGVHSAERAFKFGIFMPPDEFNIALMTLFADNQDRPRLLELVSNTASAAEAAFEDDSITQQVTLKAGVSLKARGTIKNPFSLAPHRTFPEVKQPVSPFILRARQLDKESPPHFALLECDGGAWQIDAIEGIRAWLEVKLQGASPKITILA